MNDEEMNFFKQKLEEEFKTLISRGDDISCFLYFPYSYLTPLVKQHIDDFLMEQAYSEIEKGNVSKKSFIVYRDPLLTVKLEEKTQQIELLERLIDFFTKKEEYEKCAKIQSLIKQIA